MGKIKDFLDLQCGIKQTTKSTFDEFDQLKNECSKEYDEKTTSLFLPYFPSLYIHPSLACNFNEVETPFVCREYLSLKKVAFKLEEKELALAKSSVLHSQIFVRKKCPKIVYLTMSPNLKETPLKTMLDLFSLNSYHSCL